VDGMREDGKAVVVITHLVFEEERFDDLVELKAGHSRPPAAPDLEPTGRGDGGR
jgi:hypothetical protein